MTGRARSSDAVHTPTLAQFVGVLLALTVGFALLADAFGVDIVRLGPLYMFTPAIAAGLVVHHNGIGFDVVGLRFGRKRWYALAAILPVPIVGAITLLSLGVPGVTFDPSLDVAGSVGLPSGPLWTVVAIGVIVVIGATLNAVLGFGEEFGWRGYLLWELAPLGFWKASFVIGAMWGLWHAPLILAGHNYPAFPIVGVFAITLTCIALAPLFTYVVIRSESVLPAAIFHGVFNAVGLVGYAATDDPFLRQLVASKGGLVGITVFVLIAAIIALNGTPSMRRVFPRRGHEDRSVSDEPSPTSGDASVTPDGE